MSQMPKPKSNALSGTRIGPHSGECDRLDSCPHGEVLRQILANQETQGEDLHDIKEKLMGDIENDRPGYFERIRNLESFQRVLLWIIGVAATSVIGLAVTGAWALLSKA